MQRVTVRPLRGHLGSPLRWRDRRVAQRRSAPPAREARSPARVGGRHRALVGRTSQGHDDPREHEDGHDGRPAVPARPRRGDGGVHRGAGRPGAAVDGRATGQAQASATGVTARRAGGASSYRHVPCPDRASTTRRARSPAATVRTTPAASAPATLARPSSGRGARGRTRPAACAERISSGRWSMATRGPLAPVDGARPTPASEARRPAAVAPDLGRVTGCSVEGWPAHSRGRCKSACTCWATPCAGSGATSPGCSSSGSSCWPAPPCSGGWHCPRATSRSAGCRCRRVSWCDLRRRVDVATDLQALADVQR
jgi:hypothetical protein